MSANRPDEDEIVTELRDETWHGRAFDQEIDLSDWCKRREEPFEKHEHEWAITASRLNAFWIYIFPRLAAYVWRNAAVQWPGPGVDARPWLVANIPQLPPTNDATDFLLGDFVGYLSSGCPTIPIRFRGWGGYDFILSDQGLDLFYPPWGYNRSDIFHFFTHRSTGTAAIRLPLFMNQELVAVDADAADGPQQVEIPQAAMKIILECARCEELMSLRGENVQVPFESLVTLMGRQRYWWLEGSVYRGILVHLPRVVATMWYERTESCPTHSRAYHVRYTNPGDDRHSLRSIFRERMETWLPKADAMDFQERCAGAPDAFEDCPDIETEVCDREEDGCKKTVAAPFWNPKDVMITARGMYFPCLTGQPVPTRQQILTEIEAGRAGNAVFTSTRPCAL